MLLILTAGISGCVEKRPPQTQTNVVEIEDSSFQPSSINNQSTPVVGLKLVASGFAAPMEFISSNDGRMFVVDQIGLIKVMTADGKLQDEPFLDISDRMIRLSSGYDERGLLGLAFHPDFARNGRIFVFYSAPLRPGAPEGWCCTNKLSEFRVSKDNQNIIDITSEKVLLQIDKPQTNHNGGTITFGPDGYLYLPVGDGGGANDAGTGHVSGGNSQSISTFLGKILRIDVNVNNSSAAYGIPADNPFINDTGFLPEIWAYGIRNPYRITFDSAGRLFAADAGQNLWEEVDLIIKGGNYGWNIREGTRCFNPNSPRVSPASCPDAGRRGESLLDPIIEYDHSDRTVVVGGYFYEGEALRELAGSYVFADWSSSFGRGDGTLYLARPAGEGLWKIEEIGVADRPGGRINEYIRSFGEDDEGELYILTSEVGGPTGDTGKIYRIVPAAK